ncbi:acetyl-CoA C-acetyltransferase [Psychrobacter sp. DAB_AL43B]|uniref:acetyl-CoA C-acetyltransferase n=1 Tax=Psychrobacter sp. DAB_AL43B TaxID=1028416 RepID=UPI0009A73B04|nr:acetyl-CoA C-acetyltransferase [Psychrobacter sp. DAB_AL43B]SLJ84968.1 acetyl-CoA C-acetyltransferase [Psychrobacter sp. DAB_AL43B]
MSNKNNHPDSPVVEATVVKATDAKSTDTAADKAATDTKKADTKATDSKVASPKKETPANTSKSTPAKGDTVAKDGAAKESNEKANNDKDSTDKKDADKKVEATTAKKTTTAAKKASTTKLSSGQHRVAILGGNRIPFARSNGSYADVSNTDMLTAALDGLIERYNLQDEKIGEVVAGAVMKLSRDINLTREAALNTALNPHTPTYDISQACGTGLQATFASANKIALGIIDSAITGGVDTTSDAPIAVGDGLRKVLIKLGAAKDNKQRLKALMGLNPKDLIDSPQNGEPRTGLSMGDHQAITTLEWNISREAQDELAFNSHQNLARAYDEGFFDDLITPYKGLTRDNNLRPDTTLEKLAKLKPVFGKKNAKPTMTAANSTPLTDGASCILLGTDEWAAAHGLKPLAYIVHQETAAVDFIGKSGDTEGLLMAPAYAVPRMLERAGLTLQDFDFYEIHEAFASQVLSTLAAWEDEKFCEERLGLDAPLGSIDRSKLNVNGSSLAAGHPFAATGGRILATAAKLLDQKGSGRALISICAAGGQGVTCILEK